VKTLENLVKAFIGESIARNKYSFYSKIARREGYVFVSRVFLETAENEKEHAETLFELIQKLRGNVDSIEVGTTASLKIGSTVENLKSAIEGERYENMVIYPEFSKIAEEEGLNEIAENLRAIAKAEEHHEERFSALLSAIENGTMFKREEEIEWICLECGYLQEAKEPPEMCPSCGHPKSYFVARDLLRL
jgi:rubrerythrin